MEQQPCLTITFTIAGLTALDKICKLKQIPTSYLTSIAACGLTSKLNISGLEELLANITPCNSSIHMSEAYEKPQIIYDTWIMLI
jgi:hypothetical protein